MATGDKTDVCLQRKGEKCYSSVDLLSFTNDLVLRSRLWRWRESMSDRKGEISLPLYFLHFFVADIFTRSFYDFIQRNFQLLCFWQPFHLFQPPRLLTLEFFANLPVYCTLPVYYFGRILPASPFILPSLSIWNSKV